MTVKENQTILSRATIRAITITALVAVAAVFSTQNTGVAFGSCPYTPSPGDQADLWLDMNGEDTYFTDAEWPGLEVKTFSLKGPFRGDINIRTYTGWGLTTSTTSSEISCTTAQSYTAIKNTESMPIYLKRCNWGDYTSLQFGITHERKCILNGTQSNIYPMLITESDMEGTPLTYTTGGEDGTGNSIQDGTATENDQEICTTSTVTQTTQVDDQIELPFAIRPQGDTSVRGRWVGPNDSPMTQLRQARTMMGEAGRLIKSVKDGSAMGATIQEIANTIWLMSHESRDIPVSYPYDGPRETAPIHTVLRYWVTEAGLTPSTEAQIAGVPWPVFKDRHGQQFSPAEARERYGGLDGNGVASFLARTRLRVIWHLPGAVDETLVGPAKDYDDGIDDGIGDDLFIDADGQRLTQLEAMAKYGILTQETPTWAAYALAHGLTLLYDIDALQAGNQGSQQNTQTTTCVSGQQPGQQLGYIDEGDNGRQAPKGWNSLYQRLTCEPGIPQVPAMPELDGQLDIDHNQFPGMDDYYPWHYGRVSVWAMGGHLDWQKTASGYRNGTESGVRTMNIPLEFPTSVESASWTIQQWTDWNENRQAAGKHRVFIYRRACDEVVLTQYQAYKMYNHPGDPINMPNIPDWMYAWEHIGVYAVNFYPRGWAERVDISVRAVLSKGLPVTLENAAIEYAARWETPVGGWINPDGPADALRMAMNSLRSAWEPDTYDMESNPERLSTHDAGSWLNLGIDLRLMTHYGTRMDQWAVIARVEAADQEITMVNLVNKWVRYRYRTDSNGNPMFTSEEESDRAYNNSWANFKIVWPTNEEDNPWAN